MKELKIKVSQESLGEFCRRWDVRELALFGSVLRDDFRRDSDVDVLISFSDAAQWSLYEWVDMAEELREIFGRQVDLLSRRSLRNPFRRQEILSNQKIIYAA
jgi:uncharacterized protein